MLNSLDPDQARRFLGPDQGQNCLKGYQPTPVVKELNWHFIVFRLVSILDDRKM